MKHKNDKKPDELVVMSWAGGWGHALSEAVSKPFTRLTGIKVRHKINIGLKLPSPLLNALNDAERPPFDIIWSNSVPAMLAAERGQCDFLDDETVPNRALMLRQSQILIGSFGSPVVFPYLVYFVLVYRSEVFPKGRPDSWQVLWEPRFRKKVALYPGGNGFYPVAQVLGGGTLQDIPENMEPCWRMLRQMKPQIGQLEYSIGMEAQIRRGGLDLCFRALTNALAFQKAGLAVNWTAPVEGIPDTVDALWVPAHLPKNVAHWAKRYINFALSSEVQTEWCRLLGAMPLNPTSEVPQIFRDDSSLPQFAEDHNRVLHVSDAIKVKHEFDWENRFNQIINEAGFVGRNSRPTTTRSILSNENPF